MDNLEYHPLANLFPLIEGEEFDALVGDIRANGLHDAIDLYQGKILDGRNRWRAAKAAGVELEKRNFRYFHVEIYGDPLAYVISKNLNRRHLDESQRAMVAQRLATMRQGERTDLAAAEPSANLPKVNQATAAKTLSISERALRHARRVQEHGVPELVRAVDRGRLAVSAAEQATRLPVEMQRKIAEEAEAGRANVVRKIIKQENRDIREADLADKQKALPQKRYGLIYVDVPRHFNVHSDETGMDRAPENHYPTMTFEELCDLPVQDIAADDCIMVYWSTAASLIDDLEIMAEWGFVTFRPREAGRIRRDEWRGDRWHLPNEIPQPYRSMQVWDKVRIGLGYWFRDRHEFILIGARGNVVAPAQGTQDDSIFTAKKGEHSAKPLHVAEMIERLWPNTPKIELFARVARPGWDIWGKEAPVTTTGSIEDSAPSAPDSSEFDTSSPPPESPPSSTGPMIAAADAHTQCQPESIQQLAPRAISPSPDIDLEIPPFLRRPLPQSDQAGV